MQREIRLTPLKGTRPVTSNVRKGLSTFTEEASATLKASLIKIRSKASNFLGQACALSRWFVEERVLRKKIRKHVEVFLIRIAAWILIERNVSRAKVVSRRDNNDMWYMAEKLDSICDRMLKEYNE